VLSRPINVTSKAAGTFNCKLLLELPFGYTAALSALVSK